MTDLTDADDFELLEATHRETAGGDAEYVDVTDRVSINRWKDHGLDRLYLNGLATGDGYLDLQTGESGGDRWSKVEATVADRDGDEVTIHVGRRVTSSFATPTYVIVVRAVGLADPGGGDEDGHPDDQEDEQDTEGADGDADEPRALADGGLPEPVARREQALADYILDELGRHPEEDDYLAPEGELTESHCLRRDYRRERGDEAGGSLTLTVALRERADTPMGQPGELGDVIDEASERVSDGEWVVVGEGDARARICVRGIGPECRFAAVSIDRWESDDKCWREIHHDGGIARAETEQWSVAGGELVWSAEDIRSDYWDGHGDVERTVNALISHGLTPGQAWAYYGVEVLGVSRNEWGKRGGYSDHSTVTEMAAKAKSQLGLDG